MDIGNKIKKLRTKQGLTLEELASRCELTKGFLSQLERNLTSPSITTLDDSLEALGSSLSEFFAEDKEEYLQCLTTYDQQRDPRPLAAFLEKELAKTWAE